MFEELENQFSILRTLASIQEDFEAAVIKYCESQKLKRISFENMVEVCDILTDTVLNVTGVKNDGTLEYEDSDGFTLRVTEISMFDLCNVFDALCVAITPNK